MAAPRPAALGVSGRAGVDVGAAPGRRRAVHSQLPARAVDRHRLRRRAVLTASLDLETRGYSEARGREFLRSLTERLEAAPGVVAVNIVDIVPLTLSNSTTYMLRDGDAAPARDQPPPTPQIYMNAVGPGHFKTLQIAMIAGRDFTFWTTTPRRASRSSTRRWRGASGPGRTPWASACGRSARRPRDHRGHRRRSRQQVRHGRRGAEAVPVSSAGAGLHAAGHAAGAGRRPAGLGAVDAQAGCARARSRPAGLQCRDARRRRSSISLLPARIAGSLLARSGCSRSSLAALGIYGVLSFLVRSRTREIGIRVAIGATPRAVATMVVRQAMTWTVAGAVIGLRWRSC